MKTIGQRVKDFREGKEWSTKEMAQACGTSRQNIEMLERAGNNRVPRYLTKLASVMGVSTDDLLKSEGVTNVTKSGIVAAPYPTNEGHTAEAFQIPSFAMFTPINLSSTILLLGSLLAAMDSRSRRVMGVLLAELANTPEDAQDVAEKASGIASRQQPMSRSKTLDSALQGNRSRDVETNPAPLEK